MASYIGVDIIGCRATLHIMVDDVTQRLVREQAALLSTPLLDLMAPAMARAERRFRGREQYPHFVASARRIEFREGMARAELPKGWRVGGNPRMSAQTTLLHADHGFELRLLSESTVNPNGVPHAGTTRARQELWSPQTSLPGLAGGREPAAVDRRDFLLLCDFPGQALRIVRTVEPGKYRGAVRCDFQVPLAEDVAPASFVGDEEEINLFTVHLDEEQGLG